MRSGFCTLAGTLLSDSAAAATGKDGRPTVGKPRQRKLLGGQLVAVDENQTARVEKRIPIRSIQAVQWKPPGALVNGYIEFTVPGGNETRSAWSR